MRIIMTDNELLKLIHKYVAESLKNNEKEFYNTFHSLTSSLSVSSQEQLDELGQSLFDYTTFISEVNCIAIVKLLSSLGILTISSTSD